MAQTKFSGPIKSDNGFESNTLVIGTTIITAGAVSGTVGDQAGYIPVKIGAATLYIPLYSSLTP